MMYKEKFTVCSKIHTKQMQCKHRALFLNVKPGGT